MGKEPFFGSRLALMGFSAGGHLALMEAEHWREIRTGNDAVSEMNGRPDALILAYPVVTFCGPCAHSRSRENFLGAEDAGNEMLAVKYSAEKAVGADLPPVFLWHCEGDASVPVGNSLMLRDELERSGVLHRLRIYPEGAHGLGLAQDNTEVRGWFTDCIDWLHGLGIH